MLKFWKKALSLIMVFALSMSVCMPAFAAESTGADNLNGVKIKLYDLYVKTNYDSSQVILERKQTTNEVSVTVKDKQTGKTLNVFGEIIPDKSGMSLMSEGITHREVYNDVVEGPTVSRLYATVEVYYWDSFAQINKVIDMHWQARSSGNWYLEDKYTDSWMRKTPDTSVNFRGSAVVTVETTKSTTGNFSIKYLEALGFDFTIGNGATYYGRKPISTEFGYSVM